MTAPLCLATPLACLLWTATGLTQEVPPVARWQFHSEGGARLDLHGDAERDQAGPRPPEFPDLPADNTAVRFSGRGYVLIGDPGEASHYDFANGDEITLEAWVNLERAREGQLMYVIGKGRSDSPEFARDNQNWALRVLPRGGGAHLSFLFATIPGSTDSHWHRWTSDAAFGVNTGWHHIAVAYRFGEPESIRGWIDGVPTAGIWDMGGRTTETPVVDNDSIWIGSSRGGSFSNGFHGLIDEVAIHRRRLDDETMASRFNRTGGVVKWGPQPELMPEIEDVPPGHVLFTVAEDWPDYQRWLNEGEACPQETARWSGGEFLLPRLPAKFDAWGIRTNWKAPVLLRLAADASLPPGDHRVLLRARGLSRLWINGDAVARTDSKYRKRTNLEPVEPVPDPPFPGARRSRFAQQEVIGSYRIDAADRQSPAVVRVVLEVIVGGPSLRTETSEICVAIQLDGEGPFHVLRPLAREPFSGDYENPSPLVSPPPVAARAASVKETPGQLLLEDAPIEAALDRIESGLIRYEDNRRRGAAASLDDFWSRRHALARDAALTTSHADRAAAADQRPKNKAQGVHESSTQTIDGFIKAKIDEARLRSAEHDESTTRTFHQQVLPILRENCFRCHGEKAQGGLRLDSRQQALASGDSEIPAVVPGDPEASELFQRVRAGDMPPTEEGLAPDQIATLEKWIANGALWPAPPIPEAVLEPVAVIDDAGFLRRAYLDVIGVPPSETEARDFLADSAPAKRSRLIDRLLRDERYADHWVSFWMDLFAENPTLLNASLNSTGPFRWFLHDALRDNKPIDRMVTELVLMRGSTHDGGSAGFGLAGENDAPMAEKGHILASSLLGIELQCARCHDSPYHSTTQQDLFSLAAMLGRKPMTPPKTSRVPDEFFEQKAREPLIRVSLPLGQPVEPRWPFAEVTGVEDGDEIDSLMLRPDDSRERLAALITSPRNRRFPRVMVNHLWNRLIGAAIVEPVHDWEGRDPSHPELLRWLSTQFMVSHYDAKHVLRLIMNSDLYQREPVGRNAEAGPPLRFFAAPDRRRLSAEQIVDSLFVSCGAQMDTEELTFVHDGVHPMNKRLTLGKPSRAWMLASLNNERDRPSLSLPRARPIADVLQAFGWTGSRQKPIPQRDMSPNVLQPGILANGTLTMSLTRAARGSELTELAIAANSPDALIDSLFLRFLSRYPTPQEKSDLVAPLRTGFEDRLVRVDPDRQESELEPLPQVTWTNHLVPEANEVQLELQRRVLAGPTVDPRLDSPWREVYEDVIWSLVNHREFVWIP